MSKQLIAGLLAAATALDAVYEPTIVTGRSLHRGKPLPRKVWKAKKRKVKASRQSRKANFK